MIFHERLAHACSMLHCVDYGFLASLVPSLQLKLLCELECGLNTTQVCLTRVLDFSEYMLWLHCRKTVGGG